MSVYAQGSLEIAGNKVPLPIEWPEISIKANFDQSDEATISTEIITLVNEAAQAAIKHIDDGNNGKGPGIFEGLPAKLSVFNDANSISAIDGYLDLARDYKQTGGIKAECRLVDPSQMLSFDERAAGISYEFLLFQGIITAADTVPVKYVAQRPVNALEVLTIGITTFLMIKELSEAIRNTGESIANATAHLSGGISGPIGAVIWSVAAALLNVIYTLLMVLAIVDLIVQIVNLLFPPVRTHRTMTLRKLLEIGFLYLGHTFSSDIPELDTYHYLPSKPTEEKSVTTGVPNATDFGYTIGEVKKLCENLFFAKTRIINGVVHLRPENDPFWIKTSTYVMQDLFPIRDITRYNTSELQANILLSFETDQSDEWTIERFPGTNFSVTTRPKTITDDKFVLIKNIDETRFNISLGNRKDTLTDAEKAFKALAKVADSVIKLFKGSKSFAGSIDNRIGVLQQWQNIYNNPKLLVIENSKLPKNHRTLLSAEHLWNEYHNYKSFVDNDFERQRKLYNNVDIGFGFRDYLKVVNNNYFTTADGRIGKITKFTWNISKDTAKADFWIQHKYTDNLQQTLIVG